jgi:hypothetical protein
MRPSTGRGWAGMTVPGAQHRQHAVEMATNMVRVILAVVAVAIVVILLFVSGWADDKARPGSTGRGRVAPATNDDR